MYTGESINGAPGYKPEIRIFTKGDESGNIVYPTEVRQLSELFPPFLPLLHSTPQILSITRFLLSNNVHDPNL